MSTPPTLASALAGSLVDSGDFSAIAAHAKANPEAFWLEAAQAVQWDASPTAALDASAAPLYRWFAGARLNTSFNALDRHVLAGRGDTTALIYDSPVVAKTRRYSYSQLLDKVER